MNNYLRDEINSNNRRQYANKKCRDDYKNIYTSDEDSALDSAIKLISVLLVVGIGSWGITKCVDNRRENPTRSRTTIEEIDNNYVGTAVITADGNATIVDLESYSKSDDNNEMILTTIDGEQITVDTDSVVVLSGENSHDLAFELAENMIDDNGEITELGKNSSFVKKLTL